MCTNDRHTTETATDTGATTGTNGSVETESDPTTTASSSCCSTSTATAAGTSAASTPGDEDVVRCPVMPGSVVDKAHAETNGLYREFGGTSYWLCCAGCGPRFDADPAKYAAV